MELDNAQEQIVAIIVEHERGMSTVDVRRRKAKFGRMPPMPAG